MKIAWLIQGDEQYGIRSGSKALMLALTRNGVTCPVIALESGEFTDECESIGLDVTRMELGPLPKLTGGIVNKFRQFAQLMRREQNLQESVAAALKRIDADALHFRRPNLVRIGGYAAWRNGIPSFWHMPNAISGSYPFGLNRRIYQYRCKRFGVVPLANSNYTASTLGFKPVKPLVMYLAVDPDRFDPQNIEPASRSSLGIGIDSIVFGVIARLHPNKGQNLVAKATLQLLDMGHDVHLIVIGGPLRGAYYDELAGIRETSPWKGRIHLLGPMKDVENYYRMMDFSINSRVDPEPCGISVLESMMCETPALVHASGGPSETVIDGVTGWHYPNPTVEDVKQGILRAIQDRARWAEIGRTARKLAIEKFSHQAQVNHYFDIVNATLAERS
jgi:glycosyltransferase involved in cell wall biosynthesis